MTKSSLSTSWLDGATPEGKALIYCCHTNLSPSILEKLESLLRTSINWEYFKQLAKFHGVIPLVSHALKKLPSSCIADGTLKEYSSYVQASLVLKQLIVQEMLTISRVFSQEGITVVPLKGPILALSIYERLEYREFQDLDLLVKPGDMSRAREILLSLGYTRRKGQSEETLYNNLTKKNNMFLIDLQHGLWGTSFYFSLDHEIFWSNLEKIQIQDQEILSFSPEILLILLCLHGNKHVWEYGKWICDIAELLRVKPNLDWMRVSNLAQKLHCSRQVLMGSCLANQIFQAPLPAFIHEQIHFDPDILSLSQGIPYSLVRNPDKRVYEKHREAFFLTLKETTWEKIRYALVLCRLDSDVMHDSLPWFRSQRRLKALYAVIHPCYLFIRKLTFFQKIKDRAYTWLARST
jgi:hypothetical protein